MIFRPWLNSPGTLPSSSTEEGRFRDTRSRIVLQMIYSVLDEHARTPTLGIQPPAPNHSLPFPRLHLTRPRESMTSDNPSLLAKLTLAPDLGATDLFYWNEVLEQWRAGEGQRSKLIWPRFMGIGIFFFYLFFLVEKNFFFFFFTAPSGTASSKSPVRSLRLSLVQNSMSELGARMIECLRFAWPVEPKRPNQSGSPGTWTGPLRPRRPPETPPDPENGVHRAPTERRAGELGSSVLLVF